MKVIKIGAVWGNGCLVMRPRWERIEDEMPTLETEYYDFDEDKSVVKKYEVTSGKLPCFVWLDKKGNELERISGEPSIKQLKEVIQRHRGK